MEIRARYTLIGAFTVAVIGAVLGFIYWLNSTGGLGERSIYYIRFENPVSGLLVGASAYFNGIKVGEVTNVQLNAARPRETLVRVSLDAGTPVRADTQVGIQYQGLTGAAVVAFVGGSPDAPMPSAEAGTAPILVADPAASRSWTEAARDVLGRIDGILEENSEPIRDSVKNIRSLTDVLARNSERIDGILGGLERMTGGGDQAALTTFELGVPTRFPPLPDEPDWTITVPEPSVTLAYNTDRLLKRPAPGESATFPQARWTDNLPNLFQAKILQSFESAGYLRAVLKPVDLFQADYQLLIDIRMFHLVPGDAPKARAELLARIVDATGNPVAAKKFAAEAPAASQDMAAAAAALNEAFATLATELVVWTLGAV